MINRMRREASPILPIGRIHLADGKSKYFNVYDTWGEDTTYEIYKTRSNSNPDKEIFRIVATSGTSPIVNVGQQSSFRHDQTFNFIFRGEMIDFAVGSQLKEKVELYGKTVWGYTYK